MAEWEFRPNSKGYAALLRSKGVEQELERKGGLVVQAAQGSAPVVTGAYRSSIRTEVEQHPTRVVCHVVAGTDHGAEVEFHTRNLLNNLDAARG